MAVRVISAFIMMSVRNITNMDFFFRVRRDHEISFAGRYILNETSPIQPKQTRSFHANILEIIFALRPWEKKRQNEMRYYLATTFLS